MQISQALMQLNQNRLLQQQQLEERRSYVLSQLPALFLLRQQIRETGLLRLKIALDEPAGSKRHEKLTLRLQELKKEEEALLARYPEYATMLKPQYSCSFCKDTGYDNNGQLCACIKNLLYKTDLDPAATFENFNSSIFPDAASQESNLTVRARMETYRKTAEQYCENFPENSKPNLFLIGKTGLGKTFLLNCIANRLRQSGHSVCYFTAYSLLERFRKFAFDDEPLDDVLSCDLLLIDDLGTEPVYQKVTLELLYMVINHRIMHHLPLCTATNLSVNDLVEVYADRIVSRLLFKPNTTFLKFVGNDLRIL